MVTVGAVLFAGWWVAMLCSYSARGLIHVLLPLSVYLML